METKPINETTSETNSTVIHVNFGTTEGFDLTIKQAVFVEAALGQAFNVFGNSESRHDPQKP